MLVAVLWLFAPAAQGQEMTERYIPVGAYPAAAGAGLWAGTVVAVDPDRRTVTLEAGTERYRFRVTNSTHVWLDHSPSGRTTEDGSLADVRPGLEAEVRTPGPDRDTAKWLKVRIPAGD